MTTHTPAHPGPRAPADAPDAAARPAPCAAPGAPVGPSVGEMIALYFRAYENGNISRSRAANLRAAASRILRHLPDWPLLDARETVVDAHLEHFATHGAPGLRRMTVDSYAAGFRTALTEFRAYLNDPATWHPTTRHRTPSGVDRAEASPPTALRRVQVDLPGTRTAVLAVPADLTGPEADHLARVLGTRLAGLATDTRHTPTPTTPEALR